MHLQITLTHDAFTASYANRILFFERRRNLYGTAQGQRQQKCFFFDKTSECPYHDRRGTKPCMLNLFSEMQNRSVKDYLVYIVTMTICVTLFYAFLSISSSHYSPDIGSEYDFTLLSDGMKIAICMITLLLLFFDTVRQSLYAKTEAKKEFAVQSIMGMEQKIYWQDFLCRNTDYGYVFHFDWYFLRCILLSIHYRNAPYCLWRALWNLMDIVPWTPFLLTVIIFCGKIFLW